MTTVSNIAIGAHLAGNAAANNQKEWRPESWIQTLLSLQRI